MARIAGSRGETPRNSPEEPHSSGTGATGVRRTFDALSVPAFRWLWGGMLCSMAAMQMNVIARPWLAFNLSGSALALGIVAAAQGLPQLLLAPLGGVAADRLDKRTLLLASTSSLSLLSLINAVLVQTNLITIWELALIGAVQGVIFPFTMPTRAAFIPELVGEARLANGMALDAAGRNINRVLAPSIAGLLIAISAPLAFYAIAIAYFAAFVTLLHLPHSRRPAPSTRGPLGEMLLGFQYIRRTSVVLSLMTLAFIAVILGMPFQQLLPIFQSNVLHVGPRSLGFMYTAAGVGAIIGSLMTAYLAESPLIGRIQIGLGIGFGIALVCFAMTGSFVVALGFLVLIGLCSDGFMTLNRTMVVLSTDRALYGRVISVYMMTWSLMPVALLPMGALVDRVGAPLTVAAAGSLLVFVMAAAGALLPQARNAAAPRPRVAVS